MEEKRILFVLWAANLGGVQSSIMTRIRALRRLGVKSEVLLYYSGAGKETFAGVTTYVTNKARTFAALVKRRKYDAVSFINVKPLIGALRSIKYKGKVVYELRGLSQRGLSICAGLSHRDCGLIIVPSRYVGTLVRKARTDARVAVRLVHNAVDTGLFRPRLRAEPVETALRASRGRPILLWIGRLDWNKNFIELLRIILLLQSEGVSFSPWVVTDMRVSKYAHRFEQALRVTNLQTHVRVLPGVPRRDMPYLYNAAARSGGCVLSTSRSEGLQNTLLEGMACGCPVVTSAVGGNLEIVLDGFTGFTYPVRKPTVAAQKIKELLADEALRQRFVASGLRRVEHMFSPKRHARSFMEVLEQAGSMKDA